MIITNGRGIFRYLTRKRIYAQYVFYGSDRDCAKTNTLLLIKRIKRQI